MSSTERDPEIPPPPRLPSETPTLPAPENLKPESVMSLNWKSVGSALAILVAVLTQAGVVPVAAAPSSPPPPCAPCDGSFQADVRASLERLSSGMSDVRERLARLEGPSR